MPDVLSECEHDFRVRPEAAAIEQLRESWAIENELSCRREASVSLLGAVALAQL